MFIFIWPVYLVILTRHHHNNIHNKIDNNNNNNNNTVSATHKQKSLYFLPTPTEVALYAAILYPTLQAIYTVQKATLSNNFLWLEEGLSRSFPPLVLVILDSPCLSFLLIYTSHK